MPMKLGPTEELRGFKIKSDGYAPQVRVEWDGKGVLIYFGPNIDEAGYFSPEAFEDFVSRVRQLMARNQNA